MAISQGAQGAAVEGGGSATYDSALSATVVRDAFDDSALRRIDVNNVAVAGACVLQVFDHLNPTLATTWAEIALPIAASKLISMSIQGSTALSFATGISYALTDAPHGSSLTGAARTLFALSE